MPPKMNFSARWLVALLALMVFAVQVRAVAQDDGKQTDPLLRQARAWRESVRQVTLAEKAVEASSGKKPPNLGEADWSRQIQGPFLSSAEQAAAEAIALEPAIHPRVSLVRAFLQRWLVAVQSLRGRWDHDVSPHPEHATELQLMLEDSGLESPSRDAAPNPWSETRRARAAELGETDFLTLLTRIDELRGEVSATRASSDELAAMVQICEMATQRKDTTFHVPRVAAAYLAEPAYWQGLAKLRAGERPAARKLWEQAEGRTAATGGLFQQRYRRALARLDLSAGNPPAAHERWRKILADLRGSLGNAGIHLNEAAQREQLAKARPFLEEYLALLAAHPAEGSKADAFTLRQFKGGAFVLQQRNHLERQHPTLAPLYEEWSRLVRETAQHYVSLNVPGAPRVQLADLPAKLVRISELEVEISRRRNRLPKAMSPPPEVVLPDKTLLLDYYLFSAAVTDQGARPRLACLVSRRNQATAFVDLGDASTLAKQLAAWSHQLYRGTWLDRGLRRVVEPAPKANADLAKAIAAAVWMPLHDFVQPGDHLVISPDGRLAELPWGALPGSREGTFLLEEHGISIAPVSSQLTPPLGGLAKGEGLLIVGDVEFGRPLAGETARFRSLPGTAQETHLIAELFRTTFPAAEIRRLEKGDAAELAVEKAIPGKRFIHLATHGWFVPSPATLKPGATLSGLVLAGANSGHSPSGDNILTAAEAAAIDLRGADLAVLSACETGLGIIETGEGVLGLQRAFQVAGARTVVVSLWQVDDAATQALMVEFYKNLWVRKLPRSESLRQAQLSMLRGEISAGMNDTMRSHPFFWAPFIMSGDWK